LFNDKKSTQVLKLASSAADFEDSVDKHPVTPGEVIPARELYADMLLESVKYEQALAQYQSVLEVSPLRLNALKGAAASAMGMGDKKSAQEYEQIIYAQTHPEQTAKHQIKH